MAGTIWEFFGFRSDDNSEIAQKNRDDATCPILNEKCEKTFNDGVISGVCSIKPMTSEPVICCPVRLYADDYRMLKDVCNIAFEEPLQLVPGRYAVLKARENKKSCVAVFGKKWGGELRLPQRSGRGGYFVDWVLARVNADGELMEFVAVEVQTIDTTGNYRNGFNELKNSHNIVKTTAGLNWENVSKRIIPQLIYKGQILQREELCKKGLFFVSPKPVFDRVMNRLGGEDHLIKHALQPASISFLSYDYLDEENTSDGAMLSVGKTLRHSTTVYKVQEAFNNVTLPEENAYKNAILKALGG